MLRPLVLLHGLGTGPGGWRPQVNAFSPTREVIVPPLATVEDVLDALEPDFDLCGLSLGALVGLRYAAEHPGRIRRLAVCAGFERLPWHLQAVQRTIAVAMRVVPSARVHKGLVSGVPEPHRRAALEETAHLGRADLSRIMRDGASFSLSCMPAVPVLVLCGERDRVNLALSRRLAEALPDARFEPVPDAGHVANLDNPHAFTALLQDFLDG
jgi:pimeloyl-ACP methyl ester carboxylesterase